MKKRLLPALLALVMALGLLPLSVLAVTDEPETHAGTEADPFPITAADAANGYFITAAGYYKLTEDISTPYIMPYSYAEDGSSIGDVTLDLAGFTVTHTNAGQDDKGKDVWYALSYVDESITNLTIKSSEPGGRMVPHNEYSAIQINPTKDCNHTVTVQENVIIGDKTDRDDRMDLSHAVTVALPETDATGKVIASGEIIVNLNGCTIEDQSGLTVNGNTPDKETLDVQINLTDVTMDVANTGLYLAGPATTIVSGGSITAGSVGCEIRAGSLTVKDDAQITGGSGVATSNPEGSGCTSTNAGLTVAQHTTKKPISVNVQSGTIQGGAALYVNNPQDNGEAKNVTVEVANAELTSTCETEGSEYAVYNNSPAQVTITESAMTGNVEFKKDDKDTESKGTVAVSGGTITGNVTSDTADTLTVAQAEITGDVGGNTAVTGGTITGTVGENVTTDQTADGDGDIIGTKYNLTLDATAGANLDKTQAEKGEEITVTVTPGSGYTYIITVTATKDNSSVPVTDNKFTMPGSDVTVKVEFVTAYKVTTNAGISATQGAVSGQPSESAEGETVTFTVTPKEGYQTYLVYYRYNDANGKMVESRATAVEGETNKWQLTMPASDVEICLEFRAVPAQYEYKDTGLFGGQIEFTGLSSGSYYVAQVAKTADGARAVMFFETTGSEATLEVLENPNGYAVVELFKCDDSTYELAKLVRVPVTDAAAG